VKVRATEWIGHWASRCYGHDGFDGLFNGEGRGSLCPWRKTRNPCGGKNAFGNETAIWAEVQELQLVGHEPQDEIPGLGKFEQRRPDGMPLCERLKTIGQLFGRQVDVLDRGC